MIIILLLVFYFFCFCNKDKLLSKKVRGGGWGGVEDIYVRYGF